MKNDINYRKPGNSNETWNDFSISYIMLHHISWQSRGRNFGVTKKPGACISQVSRPGDTSPRFPAQFIRIFQIKIEFSAHLNNWNYLFDRQEEEEKRIHKKKYEILIVSCFNSLHPLKATIVHFIVIFSFSIFVRLHRQHTKNLDQKAIEKRQKTSSNPCTDVIAFHSVIAFYHRTRSNVLKLIEKWRRCVDQIDGFLTPSWCSVQ